MTLARLGLEAKVVGQRSMPRSGSRSKVEAKGQVQISGAQRSILGARLCRVQQRVKKSYYQSVEFVRVSNSHADAVDF